MYDIQDEAGRTAEPRPFPFMKTLDAAEYGALLQRRSGKGAVIYKCVVEASQEVRPASSCLARRPGGRAGAGVCRGGAGPPRADLRRPPLAVRARAQTFDGWLDDAISRHDHRCFNLVGGASSSVNYAGPTMPDAAERVLARGAAFGCVTIAERHAKKGTEHTSLLRKAEMGSQWFISQVRRA